MMIEMICDVCRGAGELEASEGFRPCPFCRGTGTNSWRYRALRRQQRHIRYGRLALWGVVVGDFLLFDWWANSGDHSGSDFGVFFTLVLFLSVFAAIGLAVRLVLAHLRSRPRRRGMTGGGEWAALGALGFLGLRRASRQAGQHVAQEQAINQAVRSTWQRPR
jgi:hypothetical protein